MAHKTLRPHYSVVVVGGGIVGAGILRDLSLHNVDTLLIDKYAFSSQTSRSSSKMLHGGIRYLENMDFALVKEALYEKNLWLKLTPHLALEKRFYLPVYKDSLRPLWQMRIGVFLYDLLSLFRNSASGSLNAASLRKELPSLKHESLCGAGYYYDAVIDDEQLTIECIDSALKNPLIHAKEYISLTDLTDKKQGYTLKLRDEKSSEDYTVTCDQIIFATGPFTDLLLSKLSYINWQEKLIPSKGSHIWINNDVLNIKESVVLTPSDGRVIFVIPGEKATLVGTTEENTHVEFNLQASQEEIDYLIKNLKDYFNCEISSQDILGSFAGIRPLIKDPEHPHDRSKTARDHQIYQPHENTFVIIGGKYTTFRVMAKDVVQMLLRKRGIPYRTELSKTPL